VASGLAAYFDIDPIIVRLAFIAFAFATGGVLAVLLYAIAWAVVPADPDAPGRQGGGLPRWAWVTLAVIVGLAVIVPLFFTLFGLIGGAFGGAPPIRFGPGIGRLGGFRGFGRFGGFSGFGGFGMGPGLFWTVVLIGLGVLLFRRSEVTSASGVERAGPATARSLSTAAPLPYAQPRRPTSILGRLTVAAGLFLAGLAALLDRVGLLDLNARRVFALLLIVVGVGLLVGTLWGSARWLIAIGAVLVLILFVTSVFGLAASGRAFRGGFSVRILRPTSLAQVARPIELGAGELRLDLTGLPLTGEEPTVTAHVRAGRIEVLVPDDAAVSGRASTGTGALDIFGVWREGMDLAADIAQPGVADGGRLALDLETGVGQIVVHQRAR
jgi:phage shock protein PspC (stress-responsive transcriptional regulator)